MLVGRLPTSVDEFATGGPVTDSSSDEVSVGKVLILAPVPVKFPDAVVSVVDSAAVSVNGTVERMPDPCDAEPVGSIIVEFHGPVHWEVPVVVAFAYTLVDLVRGPPDDCIMVEFKLSVPLNTPPLSVVLFQEPDPGFVVEVGEAVGPGGLGEDTTDPVGMSTPPVPVP